METIPTIIQPTSIDIVDDIMSVGEIANVVANRTAHQRYMKSKAPQTKRRQIADIACFSRYLEFVGYPYSLKPLLLALKNDDPLQDTWNAWKGVTYGLIEAFISWQEQEGYTIGSINVRLATIKTYCGLAYRAGAISQAELTNIKMINGNSHREGINIDKGRDISRLGNKKESPTLISPVHADLLKKRQRRPKDAAMMCLLLDLGLRCGELAILTVKNVNLTSATITFYREKVDLHQTHQLTPDCLLALQAYLPTVKGDFLFAGHNGKAMTTNGINKRVGELGKAIGIANLSPHDCRHHLITEEVRKGTDTKTLQLIGGWSSPSMALKYAQAGEIANSGASFFRQGSRV